MTAYSAAELASGQSIYRSAPRGPGRPAGDQTISIVDYVGVSCNKANR